MSTPRDYLERLLSGESLGVDDAAALMRLLTDPELPPSVSGALLAALRTKGETSEEVRGFAQAMRALARRPAVPDGLPAVDIVGTGGDGSGSLNLSTGAALLLAACGQPVIKHGNRSVSSRSGSADVLEVLGLALPLDEQAAARCLEATGFTFLFAPYYHPATKAVAAVRRTLGVRTVFNLLGPLTNPAAPPYCVLGAFDSDAARLMAHTLAGMGIERGFVVHGEPGWDEATPVGIFELFDVRDGEVKRKIRDPADVGLARCDAAALAGGDAVANAAALRDAFAGRGPAAHRDALALGAGLGLEVCGAAATLAEGVGQAQDALADGRAGALLDKLTAFSRPAT